jgi:hypothetical protein
MRDGWSPDRRRADRRRVPAPLTVTHLDTGARWPVVDIGRLGLVIELDRAMPQGAAFACAFGDDTIEVGPVDGRVAHCRLLLGAPGATPRYLAGISFGTLTTSAGTALDTLLARFEAASTPRDRS